MALRPSSLRNSRQVLRARNHLLDAGDRDVDARQRGGHARVAFVCHQHDRAANPPPGSSRREMPMSAARNFSRSTARAIFVCFSISVSRSHAELLGEQVRHVVAGLVQRRRDDVIRPLVCQLDDVLAEVGLDRSRGPACSSRSFRSISSVVIDFDFTMQVGVFLLRQAHQELGPTSSPSRAQITLPPRASHSTRTAPGSNPGSRSCAS